ncbi:MAG: hypothetical protein QY309_17325 [Cyclobacteriaceae bacterium]|nr:MAG: hypothetical protein QY309_17325 [Cyclobacteriaceae bacterium]
MKLNSQYFFIAFCCIGSILVNCNDKPIPEYSLDSFLEKIRFDSSDTVVQVNICHIIEADWDSLLIIKPYVSVSRQSALLNLVNYSAIKPKIKDIRYSDGFSYLVFIKRNRAIGLSKVSNVPINFGSLPSRDDSNPSVAVLDKKDCIKELIVNF